MNYDSINLSEVAHAHNIDVLWSDNTHVLCAPTEHPPPHFHAYYGKLKATVNIHTCEIIQSDLPRRQERLIIAWAELHQEELSADWELVMNGEEPFKIQPLS